MKENNSKLEQISDYLENETNVDATKPQNPKKRKIWKKYLSFS